MFAILCFVFDVSVKPVKQAMQAVQASQPRQLRRPESHRILPNEFSCSRKCIICVRVYLGDPLQGAWGSRVFFGSPRRAQQVLFVSLSVQACLDSGLG